jgi:hypothetical protein
LEHHLTSVSATELESLFGHVIASQEARKDSISANSSSSSLSLSSSSNGSPPNAPKSPRGLKLARKASMSILSKLKINSPNAKKEPKDI